MTATAAVASEVLLVVLDEIEPDPDQPRTEYDEELAASIGEQGVLQPITVRIHPDAEAEKSYRIVDGERRWRGARKAGLETIPVIVRDDVVDEATRLIRQSTFNTGKPLTPIEEAKAWKRIQELTGKNIAELARMLGRPKSTVSDRLALADAPSAFQPLFARGVLTAAAAPIVRKFAEVPPDLLEEALKDIEDDWGWKDALQDHDGVVPLQEAENILNDVILNTTLYELPADLLGEFKGPTCTVQGKVYATDRDKAAQWVAKFRAKNPEVKPKAQATKKAELSPGEKKWREDEKKRREERERVKSAVPAIRKAIGAAIVKASASTVTGHLLDVIIGEFRWLSVKERQAISALVPRGKTPLDNLRHVAMCVIDEQASNEYHLLTSLPKILKPLGLDVRKIVDEAAPPKPPEAKPAKKAAKKGKK